MRIWPIHLDQKVVFTVAVCLLKDCDIRNTDKVTVELELRKSNLRDLTVIPDILKFKKRHLKQELFKKHA